MARVKDAVLIALAVVFIGNLVLGAMGRPNIDTWLRNSQIMVE